MSSLWINTTEEFSSFDRLEKDTECDVCIIGAGLTGLATAYYLSKQGLKVVILEKAPSICEQTCGNTGAKITSQHGLFYNYLINTFGKDSALQYLNANNQAIQDIKNIVESENIDCDLINEDNYVYTTDENEIIKIKHENIAVNSLGFNSEFVTESPLPFEIKAAIKFPNQACFHPRKYCIGLLKSILKNNAEIHNNTNVIDIQKDFENYVVFTESNRITCKYAVIATKYPFINAPGFYFMKMYQSTSFYIAIRPNAEIFDGMYITSKEPIYSFRNAMYNGERILLVGGNTLKTGIVSNLQDAYLPLENKARELYPNCEILFRWNTEDSVSLDKIPYIGTYSTFTPNLYVATGYNKWGMTSSHVAARLISDEILGIDNPNKEVFRATRFNPIKNKAETTNLVKQAANSIALKKPITPISSISEMKNDSGSIVEIDGTKVGIYKDTSGNIFAVNPVCKHLGCLLSWNNLEKTWDCPCHGSRYDFMGNNIYGPATKDLDKSSELL